VAVPSKQARISKSLVLGAGARVQGYGLISKQWLGAVLVQGCGLISKQG